MDGVIYIFFSSISLLSAICLINVNLCQRSHMYLSHFTTSNTSTSVKIRIIVTMKLNSVNGNESVSV